MNREQIRNQRKHFANQLRELADEVEDEEIIPICTEIGREANRIPIGGKVGVSVAPYFNFKWVAETPHGQTFEVEIPRREVSDEELEEIGF